jgi:hypothetical protein
MLLSSVLQILNQYQPQSAAAVEKTSKTPARSPAIETFSVEQEASPGLETLKIEIAAAAGLLRPLSPDPDMSPVALPGPSLEELMQIIEKLKAPDQSRVIDVFE